MAFKSNKRRQALLVLYTGMPDQGKEPANTRVLKHRLVMYKYIVKPRFLFAADIFYQFDGAAAGGHHIVVAIGIPIHKEEIGRSYYRCSQSDIAVVPKHKWFGYYFLCLKIQNSSG